MSWISMSRLETCCMSIAFRGQKKGGKVDWYVLSKTACSAGHWDAQRA